MPRAGKYDYPFFDVDSMVTKLKEFHQVIKADDTTREIIAETLGMSATGGGFSDMLTSLKKYGFIQTSKGNVTITKRGKLAVYGEPREIKDAKAQAVKI